jgi:undecaprenyl-diphosphatase
MDAQNYPLLSAILGVIEGLTEFIPVSSTAHLRIAEGLLSISLDSGYWKMYSVVIQLGAILSVPLLFWDRIVGFLKTFPKGEKGDRTLLTHPLSLVMIAFVVTAGPSYLADKYIGKNLESLYVIGGSLVIGGVIMWIVDAAFRKPTVTHMEDMGLLDAIWIGGVQILSAVFPGTSRSMATIAGGQVFGLSRATALEFSFFLSIPTMTAASLFKLLQGIKEHLHPKPGVDVAAYNAPPHQWLVLGIGFVVSFVVAWLVNRWFINWVRKHGFAPFAIYRLIVGTCVLIWAYQSVGK